MLIIVVIILIYLTKTSDLVNEFSQTENNEYTQTENHESTQTDVLDENSNSLIK